MRPKVGLFGGTFDPVHFGHIHLAIELKERCELEEVWWIPAWCSPLRTEEKPEKVLHRLKMVELAVSGISGFKVLDLEIKKEGPSYTIETVEEILSIRKDCALLLGEDALIHFSKWKDVISLVKKIPLKIGLRPNFFVKERLADLLLSESVIEAILKGWVEIPLIDISSTTVRNRLKKKLYCGHLVPSKVMDYIYENHLYLTS